MLSTVSQTEVLEECAIFIPKKIAVISVGLPGVGKSTLLKVITQKISNSSILDKDTICQSLLRGHAYNSSYYKKYVKEQSYELLFSLAKDNLTTQKIVFLDGFFGDKLRTPLVSSFLKIRDFEIKIIFFFCSMSVNRSRLIERGNPRDHEKLLEFEKYYTTVLQAHQEELKNFPYQSIDTEQDTSINVSKILQYLS